MKRERLSESSPAFRILTVEPRYGQICRRLGGTGYPSGVAGTCAEDRHGLREIQNLFSTLSSPCALSYSCTICSLAIHTVSISVYRAQNPLWLALSSVAA